MIVRMKDPGGLTVLVNPAHVSFVITQMTDKGPILGQSIIINQNGNPCLVKGTPEEVYGMLRRGELNQMIDEVGQ